jgi:hypothetical protein
MRFLHGKGLLDTTSSCDYLRLQLVGPGNPLLNRVWAAACRGGGGILVQQVALREILTSEDQADGAVMLVMSWVDSLLARKKMDGLCS